MTYFVTGATGFLGRNLIVELLKREGDIYVLVRAGSKSKVIDLIKETGGEGRIHPINGDLGSPLLGVSDEDGKTLKGKIDHFFHLAAIYDLANTNHEQQIDINVDGTRQALKLAEALNAGCFHHTSSIAAAGLYDGTWREDMFLEWEENSHPYYRTKHDSEAVLRDEATMPWRIYRPGIVIGRSDNGAIDKIDGPYFFFPLLKGLKQVLPDWTPMVGIDGGNMNLVPVDYVVRAMDHIAHKAELDGQTFHLTADEHPTVGQVLNIFAKAAGAPRFTAKLDNSFLNMFPSRISGRLMNMPLVKGALDRTLGEIGIPAELMKFVDYPTIFDNRQTKAALADSDIHCPPLKSYAQTIWDYWLKNLDADQARGRTLKRAVKGKVALVTGASSGIGEATAIKLAKAGATVLLCARTPENLKATQEKIEGIGGKAYIYQADVADIESCDALIAKVMEDHGRVDILVNNAGRSIRRSISLSYDRFHDYERTMQLNYFGALRLIMGVLPSMTERKSGHIINISSIGVQVNQPRFSAYVASKAALDAFARCAQPEFLDKNVHFTNIYMPLVKTPMIAPTKMYDYVPTLTPEQAADMVVEAIVERPKRVSTQLGTMAELMWAVAPRALDMVFNRSYRLFPDSSAAKGEKSVNEEAPTTEAVAFASLTRGVHW
ncbi:MAG: SDR family oxidoreductase [Alphaproteobacteria bacterium]